MPLNNDMKIFRALIVRIQVFFVEGPANICHMIRSCLGIIFFGLCLPGFSQDSIQSKQLDAVVVTATRNERTMGALPMPVLIVQKSQIKAMGSLRLSDVLVEQTGLAVVPQVNGQVMGSKFKGLTRIIR